MARDDAVPPTPPPARHGRLATRFDRGPAGEPLPLGTTALDVGGRAGAPVAVPGGPPDEFDGGHVVTPGLVTAALDTWLGPPG